MCVCIQQEKIKQWDTVKVGVLHVEVGEQWKKAAGYGNEL